MEQLSPVVTPFLVVDPLGNVPLFLSVLKTVPPERRRVVPMRESTFLYSVPGNRGLTAMERLMGMLLVMAAVQMLLDGVKVFMRGQ